MPPDIRVSAFQAVNRGRQPKTLCKRGLHLCERRRLAGTACELKLPALLANLVRVDVLHVA